MKSLAFVEHGGKAIRSIIKYLVFVVCTFSFSPSFADVVPMLRGELIQRSDTIFTGGVETKKSRWNDIGNLIVTDYTFVVEEVLYGQLNERVTLTFAGGELANKGHSVSDVPSFNVGERVLLMLEESEAPLLSPVTGMYLGKFTASYRANFAEEMALDGNNLPVSDQNQMPLSFTQLILEIKREIPIYKSMPLPDRSVPAELDRYILKDLPEKRYDPSPREGYSEVITQPGKRSDTSGVYPERSPFSLGSAASRAGKADNQHLIGRGVWISFAPPQRASSGIRPIAG